MCQAIDVPRSSQKAARAHPPAADHPPGAYHRGTWLVLANPRPGVLGVIALIDPARTANHTDLAALEYAATVLSVELSRLQSVAEAELRSQRDFAEELLAGADEPTVKVSAHALGYDPERPHRVIIATGRPRDNLDEQFFQAVVREVRRLDLATLIVGRANYIVIIAYREARLKRVRELLGQDLNDGSVRLDLHLATRVGSRLKAFAGQSKPDHVKVAVQVGERIHLTV